MTPQVWIETLREHADAAQYGTGPRGVSMTPQRARELALLIERMAVENEVLRKCVEEEVTNP